MSQKVESEGYSGANGSRYPLPRGPFVLVILLAGSVLTSAQEPPQRVTLEQALRMFEENNLELRLVTAERDVAGGLAEQARAYPNPVVTLTHEGLSEGGADYSESYFTASQHLEWPGRRAARIASSDQDAAAAESRVEVERRRLLFEVKRAFLEAAAAERQLAAIEEVRGVFRFAEESGRQRLREGDLSGYDVRRLRIERARYENLATTQAIALQNARLHFGSLVLPGSLDESQGELVPAALPDGRPPALMGLGAEAALERALEIRADLRGAEAQVAAAEAALRHVSTFRYPEVTLTGGYKRQSDSLDGYFLGASLPLPILDRRRGDIAAAEARVRQGTAQLDLVRRTVANDVRIAFSTYLSVLERVELIRGQLLNGVDDLLRIAQVSYGEGEMSLLELLDAADAYRESQTAISELTGELWIRYYDLERAIGGLPSTNMALEGQQ
ncbi:MAG: TolC family protein [Vicinamibacteria bacterium]